MYAIYVGMCDMSVRCVCSVCMYASVCQALVRVREHALMLT